MSLVSNTNDPLSFKKLLVFCLQTPSSPSLTSLCQLSLHLTLFPILIYSPFEIYLIAFHLGPVLTQFTEDFLIIELNILGEPDFLQLFGQVPNPGAWPGVTNFISPSETLFSVHFSDSQSIFILL